MSDKTPTAFLLRTENEKHHLHLGGFSTQEGLQLFDMNLAVTVSAAYFNRHEDEDGEIKKAMLGSTTVGEAIAALDLECPYDFSCIVDGRVCLSSNDDGQCDFILESKSIAKDIVLRSAPGSLGPAIWDKLTSNPNCYVTLFESETKISVFKDFESFQAARKSK